MVNMTEDRAGSRHGHTLCFMAYPRLSHAVCPLFECLSFPTGLINQIMKIKPLPQCLVYSNRSVEVSDFFS